MELKDEAFPDSMYAVAKLFGEDIGRLCALQSKLECVALRIGWVNSAIVGMNQMGFVNFQISQYSELFFKN